MEKKQVRGPRRLEYLPAFAKEIRGIAYVTTVSQLSRLQEYMAVEPDKRRPFMRLGCSVSHDKEKPIGVAQNSTWAVSCDGQVEVIRKNGDPRSAHKWFGNPARSWNVFHQFQADPQALVLSREQQAAEPAYYIAMVAVQDEPDEGALALIVPDGEKVVSVRYRRLPKHQGVLEALVFARPGWFEDPRFYNLLFSIREAVGEIFANEDGAVWVTADKCVEFPSLSFSDTEAMAHNRQLIPNLHSFLLNQAHLHIRSKLRPFGLGKALEPPIEAAIVEALREQNLHEISLPDLDALIQIIQGRSGEKAA